MSIGIVIIYGAAVGLIASYFGITGFGLWWNIYLGIAGSTFASLIMIFAYIINIFSTPDVIGFNLFSIEVDIIGAAALVCVEGFYNRVSLIIHEQRRKLI